MKLLITRNVVGQVAIWGLLAVVLYFCFRLMEPFLMPIFLAVIIATLLAPLYDLFLVKLKGRKSLAALIICLGLTLTILMPVLVLSISLTNEATVAYGSLNDPQTLTKIESWMDPTRNPAFQSLMSRLPASIRSENSELASRLGAQAQKVAVIVVGVATDFATGLFNFLMDYFIMIVVMFFLLRDSKDFAATIRSISPLSDKEEDLFVDRFRSVTRAVVLGNLGTSLTQGAIGGMVFLSLGLPSPLLWGALTALLSLVPVVGTALVWIPWTIYLVATGATTKAVIFLILEVVVVGATDNFLRPLFMEKGVKMHTLALFFSILGGIGYFGILGMFIGPLIFSMALALLEVCIAPEVAKE